MTERAGSSTEVKPLTKRSKATEQLYVRRSEVEFQIQEVISFGTKEIFRLLENKNKHSADYLFDETLVYLLREAQIRKDNLTLETLYSELNRRIWKFLKKFYKYYSNEADYEDFRQKVEIAAIQKIFNLESNSADYAQVNFGDFIITLANVIWRGNLNKNKREQELFYAAPNENEEGDSQEILVESKDISAEDKLILREGIAKLPQHIRQAAFLILDGWQIESKNENEPTISKYLKVSSRTIRNWLKEARQILAGYEGEIR